MPSHLEIEKKFAVGEKFALPDFADAGTGLTVDEPRELELSAVYHDTADLALTASRISLRRRTGGDDEGWHLKLPAPAGRMEIRRPLDGDVPPVELTDLVRAYVGRDLLRPVARIDDQRTVRLVRDGSGTPVVEIADDRVVGSTLGEHPREIRWREVEVELVGAARSRLVRAMGRQILAAGASDDDDRPKVRRVLGHELPPEPAARRPRTAGEVIRSDLQARISHLVAMDAAVRQDLPDSVHQLRVAANRIRAELRTFRDMVGADRTDALDPELRWLRSILGDVRDAELLERRLLDHIHAQPVELVRGPVAARIQATLGRRVLEAREHLMAGLRSDRYLALLADLRALVARPFTGGSADAHPKSLDAYLARGRRKVSRRLATAEKRTAGSERDTATHLARKAAKRLRYAADVCVTVRGKPAKKLGHAANRLQDHLGERQDSVVAAEVLAQLATAAQGAPGESGFTFGLLLGLEQARTRSLDDTLPKILARSPF